MSWIGVFSNPRSRRNLRDPGLVDSLSGLVTGEGWVESPSNPDDLPAAARRFREAGCEVLAINGGDGTCGAVLTAVASAWGDAPLPAIALLRGGTMNTIAHSVGVRGRPAEILGSMMKARANGQTIPSVQRWLLEVDGRLGFLFGNGVISGFMKPFYEGGSPSPSKAAWVLLRAVGSALVGGEYAATITRPVRCEVRVDGQAWETRSWLAIGAGTVDDVGLRFRPFFRSLSTPGRMHAVGLGCSPFQFAFQIHRARCAKPFTRSDIVEAMAIELVLQGEEPMLYMMDGDLHQGASKVVVRVGPCVSLLVPPR